jgi:hypothetical protein
MLIFQGLPFSFQSGTEVVIRNSEKRKRGKEEQIMKSLFEKFETVMVAASFAEEGEFEMARQIMKEDQPRKTDRPSARDFQRPAARKELRAD